MTKSNLPPLMQFIYDLHKKHPDAIVCVNIGSFYEIHGFGEPGQAKEASEILDLVLTRRSKLDPHSPYMAGFPVVSAPNYFKKLVEAGKTVVVVDQAINGKKSDGNKQVVREVAQILSPGTVIDSLSKEKTNYFASLYFQETNVGVSLIDVSTGEVIISEMGISQLTDFLEIKAPAEILIVGDTGNHIIHKKEHQIIHNITDSINKLSSCGTILGNIYSLPNPTSNPTSALLSLGIEMWRLGSLALGNLLNYLTDYNPLLLKKVSPPTLYSLNDHITLPHNAFISLDIFKTQNGKEDPKETLIGAIDRCKTAMGQRRLRQLVQGPLNDLDQINSRLDKVEDFLKQNNFLTELKDVYDFVRLSRRMSLNRLMPHEILNLYQSVKISQKILNDQKIKDKANTANQILEYIDSKINLSEANGLSEFTIDFFCSDLDKDLSEIHDKWKKEDAELQKLKSKFESLLGIENKLRINEKLESFTLTGPKGLSEIAKKKGLAIQIKASDIQIVDEDWIEISKICLHYRHRFLAKAQEVWENFQSDFVQTFGDKVIEISNQIADLDVLSNFAQIAKERDYTRPTFVHTDEAYVNFKNLRHPVVELSENLTEGFVANNVQLGKDRKTLVIFGANSSGKSTFLKSLAINILLSHMGSFVAASAGSELSVFDAILTRIASFDSLSEGLSTFTLEMFELQSALKYKNKKVIFLFDEIGRGTSVEDGEAIAYGTLAFLDSPDTKAITLFATHYHSLVKEISQLKSVAIKNVSCHTDEHGVLIFERKLKDGPGNGSYGVEVAKSCGIPDEIIRIANRYNQTHFKLKSSRYNKALQSTLCELCHKNPFQQTHHILEQKQGKVKKIEDNGQIKDINDKSNLVMLCATCHELITRKEIEIIRKIKTSNNQYFLEVIKTKKQINKN
jgi:DNA mismatch repair protein MutS